MKTITLILICLLNTLFVTAQNNKLKIIGAYYYGQQTSKDIHICAIEVTGDVNLIGDPDDITFANADNNKSTGYAIDDFSFLSPDGKQQWINLPSSFDKKHIRAVMITGVPKGIKRIKLQYDASDISDAAKISGNYPLLLPIAKRIKHKG